MIKRIKGTDYKTVDLYYEPSEILNNLSEENSKSEMTPFEQAFLCGLIKEYKPKKLVEVGVAAGTTSLIVLNCLSKLDLCSQFYSVDISEEYYKDDKKRTGFVIDECKELISTKVEHSLLLGKELAEQIDNIGDGIDFLIIDTAHTLPGELLDFLAAYPYLSENAVVVLHDVTLNAVAQYPSFIATKLVLDTVTADKFYQADPDRIAGLSNIAAFMINENTMRYIGDVFSCMTISWKYLPSEESVSNYRTIIERNYDSSHLKQFDDAWELQKSMRAVIEADNFFQRYSVGIPRDWAQAEHVLLYGCGKVGQEYYKYATENGLRVDGMIVSDLKKISEEEKSVFSVPVYEWGTLPFGSDECKILITVGRKLYNEILRIVIKDGYEIL